MKSVVLIFICSLVGFAVANLQCQSPTPNDIPTEWKDMSEGCIGKMKDQVKEELKAAMTYMAMGAHFSKDTVNRPGFAKMFFESASEEREHAIKLIHYLLMRGELTTGIASLISKNIKPLETFWTSGVDALKAALNLEADVTKKIRKVIEVCEDDASFNDYHLVDYLTGDFLDEQYKGQREIAGKVSTLGKLMDKHGALGEFLFDKKILNGEL